jgi:hypothetical protein
MIDDELQVFFLVAKCQGYERGLPMDWPTLMRIRILQADRLPDDDAT